MTRRIAACSPGCQLERLRFGELVGSQNVCGGSPDSALLVTRAAPDATRPPGWKPAACNRWASGALRSRAKRGPCDALPSVAMTMTGHACLALPCLALPCLATCTNARRSLSDNDQSGHPMLARPATMWSLKTDSSHNLFFKKRQPGCQNFQCDPSGTLPFDGDSFSREKLAR